MKKNINVYERLRSHLDKKNLKYGWPSNRLISDYMLSMLKVPLFYQNQDLSLHNETLLRKFKPTRVPNESTMFYARNAILNVYSVVSLVGGLFFRQDTREKVYVLFSLTSSQFRGNDQLRDFMMDPRFSLNIDAETVLLVEQNRMSMKHLTNLKSGNTICVLDAMTWMYRNFLKPRQKLKLLLMVMREVFISLFSCRFYAIFLFKQLIVDRIILQFLAQSGISLTLMTTQSQLKKLSPSFYFAEKYGMKRIMFWYSDNSWAFENTNTTLKFDNSRYLRDFVDLHYCWSAEWCEHLKSIGIKEKIVPVGSLMLYRNSLPSSLQSKNYDILIFDVMPIENSIQSKFYSNYAIAQFYSDISSSVRLLGQSTTNIRIGVKNKRVVNAQLTDWVKTNNASFVNPDENLYELISSTKLVIGIPLVSPLTIAAELNIPAAYYYPLELGSWQLPKSYAGASIYREKEDLRNWISRNLEL